ncbi:hypothetical protein KKD61_04120 [Patescibacteria group bacterium]|nr:hypothetical protein [Patescibacteria group bacterium]
MLERLKRRGGSINLIVHESKINQTIRELEYSGRNPEYLAALKEVSQEIKGVKKSPDTGFVAVEHYEPRRIGDDIGRAGQGM